MGYLLLSAVIPGSVQLISGARTIGRLAIRVWLVLWVAGVVAALGLVFFRGPTIGLLLNQQVLLSARVLLWILTVGWVGLLIDSWRRCKPLTHQPRARLAMTTTVGLLILSMTGGAAVASSLIGAASDVSSIFGGSGDPSAESGRINILLLGGDSGPSREGMRPDSIMVASIEQKTGKTVLFGLPRNLEGVPFPTGNPLGELYPHGYDCAHSACMLNGVYTLAHEHADLFPGVGDPGLKAMQDVVGNILGLKINYYALVDLAGFQSLVDAVGGIRVDVGKRIPIAEGGQYIEPGKNQLLDGYNALWFARSRRESSDYDRMARQRCVLAAMVKQLDPMMVATRFSDLAAAGKGLVRTSVPTGEISNLIDLALRVKDQPISSLAFSPPLINPGKPDFDLIKREVKAALEPTKGDQVPPAETPQPVQSTAATSGSSPREDKPREPAASPSEAGQRTPIDVSQAGGGATQDTAAGGGAPDLAKVCSAS